MGIWSSCSAVGTICDKSSQSIAGKGVAFVEVGGTVDLGRVIIISQVTECFGVNSGVGESFCECGSLAGDLGVGSKYHKFMLSCVECHAISINIALDYRMLAGNIVHGFSHCKDVIDISGAYVGVYSDGNP